MCKLKNSWDNMEVLLDASPMVPLWCFRTLFVFEDVQIVKSVVTRFFGRSVYSVLLISVTRLLDPMPFCVSWQLPVVAFFVRVWPSYGGITYNYMSQQ